MVKTSILSIQKKYKQKVPITALTCYDAASASLIDEAGIDIGLVGDSLANTRLGYENTLPVTVEEMLHHTRSASRGLKKAFLVADMPFQSYEWAPWEATKAAGRFIKEGRAQAVKLEGGKRISKSVQAILNANIPVMGHLGLTPQSLHQKGGYFVQGKGVAEAKKLLSEAKLLEKLGVFSLVLEGIPLNLAKKVTKSLKIPTIGIGAGPHCSGQILVLDDLLGMTKPPLPKFVKQYAQVRKHSAVALRLFKSDVMARRFPSKKYSY